MLQSTRFRIVLASLGLAALAWPAGILAAPPAAPVYTLSISPADLKLQGRGVAELRAKASPPLTIAFERSGGNPGIPTLRATVLTGSCSPDGETRESCDRATLDFATGHVEFRSFSRRKGIVATLEGLSSVWDSKLRVTSRPTRATPRLAMAVQAPAPGSSARRITSEAHIEDRRYSLSVDSPIERGPARLLPLVALLHQVIAAETRPGNAVARTITSEPGTTQPSGTGSGSVCDLCDFCSDLPGGHTLGGCLGDPGGGGGGIGGGGGGSPTPPPPPPPPPPSPCTITTEQALEVLADVLFFEEEALSLCKSSLSTITGTYAKLFNDEAKHFKSKRDTAPDPSSKGCANCFFQVTRRFGALGLGISSLKSILSPKCIRNYGILSSSANAAQLSTVRGIALKYLNDLATCKRGCDAPAAPALHRGYCDCRADYLHWETSGPRPGSTLCPL